MKGDFSYFPFDRSEPYSGVLQQQGRVTLDSDWNEQRAIDARWRGRAAEDAFGLGVLAVPATDGAAFKVTRAAVDGDRVRVTLEAGHAWASGLLLTQAAQLTLDARYTDPPLAPAVDVASIDAGTRDLVYLEVWEDAVSAFQDTSLLEPALGGPDTTERTRTVAVARLLRLGPNDDCSAVRRLVDTGRGRLTVSPAPVLAVGGDCPLEAGGGYTGLEHDLYRIEIAEPLGARSRFKWSQFNGGLVGRGLYTPGTLPGTGNVDLTANVQAIELCGVDAFYLEASSLDADLNAWRVVFSADATRTGDGRLTLANVQGTWPATAPATGFFRLWNGIALIADFPPGNPTELKDGIRLEFDIDDGFGGYRAGDYWSFPVRASGAAFEAPLWPVAALPYGIAYRRVALAEITWNAQRTASFDAGEIEDCRHVFRPLTNQKICCTFNVGDGRTSFGDFDRIDEAVRHLPAAGGEICLLPGLHHTCTVIRSRQHVSIRGCGTQTKVTPDEKTPTQPIFAVVDSADIELLAMDLFTMGGSAVVVGGSKPGAASDVRIAGNRILACDNAVRASNTAALVVRENRIRMLDKRGSGVGIYAAGDDTCIERNDVRLMPFREMPPIDVPEQPNDPIDPTDPCAKIELAFANPRIFLRYVDLVWQVALPLVYLQLAELAPYRALGGIQIGGGSERVQVRDNTVVGGAGNGITLGAAADAAPPAPVFSFEFTDPDGRVLGIVTGPDGKPLAGVQITLTPTSGGNTPTPQVTNASGQVAFGVARGTYRVEEGAPGLEIASVDAERRGNGIVLVQIRLQQEAAPPTADDGFLYTVTIERNTVSAMGLCGIGVPPQALPAAPTLAVSTNAVTAARALLGCPIVGLVIRANLLTGNMRNPFDNALRQQAATRGFGGISLGLVDDALIVDNRIEKNGRTGVDPLCGIWIQYGEDVDIHHNQVLDNGALPGAREQPVGGRRGGIVVGLASSFGLLAALQGGTATVGSRPAARICDNTVSQPVGCALQVRAIGPLAINDNSFASEFAGVAELEQIAGTVLIYNLGGVAEAGASTDFRRPASEAVASADAPPPPTPNNPLGTSQRTRLQAVEATVTRAAAATTLLPAGNTLFNDNQSRTGAANRAAACQLISSLDDIGYAGNQSYSIQAGRVYANVLLSGATVRAIGNRLRESNREALMSMFTLGQRANDTSLNQGDHCIIASDQNPGMAEVQIGNQVLFPSALCARVNMTAALLLKPLG